MDLVARVYAAAANVGLLRECRWEPAAGGAAQIHQVGFAALDETIFDGLTSSTDYVMSYPATIFTDLTVGATVMIGGGTFQVREIRAVGDGGEIRAKLTRL